jgi:hypothetical protein
MNHGDDHGGDHGDGFPADRAFAAAATGAPSAFLSSFGFASVPSVLVHETPSALPLYRVLAALLPAHDALSYFALADAPPTGLLLPPGEAARAYAPLDADAVARLAAEAIRGADAGAAGDTATPQELARIRAVVNARIAAEEQRQARARARDPRLPAAEEEDAVVARAAAVAAGAATVLTAAARSHLARTLLRANAAVAAARAGADAAAVVAATPAPARNPFARVGVSYAPEYKEYAFAALGALFGARPGLEYRVKAAVTRAAAVQCAARAASRHRGEYEALCRAREDALFRIAARRRGEPVAEDEESFEAAREAAAAAHRGGRLPQLTQEEEEAEFRAHVAAQQAADEAAALLPTRDAAVSAAVAPADVLAEALSVHTVTFALHEAERAASRDDALYATRLLVYLCGGVTAGQREDARWGQRHFGLQRLIEAGRGKSEAQVRREKTLPGLVTLQGADADSDSEDDEDDAGGSGGTANDDGDDDDDDAEADPAAARDPETGIRLLSRRDPLHRLLRVRETQLEAVSAALGAHPLVAQADALTAGCGVYTSHGAEDRAEEQRAAAEEAAEQAERTAADLRAVAEAAGWSIFAEGPDGFPAAVDGASAAGGFAPPSSASDSAAAGAVVSVHPPAHGGDAFPMPTPSSAGAGVVVARGAGADDRGSAGGSSHGDGDAEESGEDGDVLAPLPTNAGYEDYE